MWRGLEGICRLIGLEAQALQSVFVSAGANLRVRGCNHSLGDISLPPLRAPAPRAAVPRATAVRLATRPRRALGRGGCTREAAMGPVARQASGRAFRRVAGLGLGLAACSRRRLRPSRCCGGWQRPPQQQRLGLRSTRCRRSRHRRATRTCVSRPPRARGTSRCRPKAVAAVTAVTSVTPTTQLSQCRGRAYARPDREPLRRCTSVPPSGAHARRSGADNLPARAPLQGKGRRPRLRATEAGNETATTMRTVRRSRPRTKPRRPRPGCAG